jgi:Flp pilus assembly protein TadD
MRHPVFLGQRAMLVLCLGTVGLMGCQKSSDAEVSRAIKAVNVIDESNLSDIMLTVGDPNESVAYFRKTLADNPDRIDVRRGLAMSLVRAQNPQEGSVAWASVVEHPQSTNDDRVSYADALIRSNEWARAEAELNKIPPTHETFERYKLEAMVADSKKNWKKADSFYEIAAGLTSSPAGIYNNWGFSKLTRGDYSGAEKLFYDALTYDPQLFTAKNNIVLARGAQRKYDLPVIKMTQIERAQLLHTMALTAVKQGDIQIGKGLLQEAINQHPQYFEAAERSLSALDAKVTN